MLQLSYQSVRQIVSITSLLCVHLGRVCRIAFTNNFSVVNGWGREFGTQRRDPRRESDTPPDHPSQHPSKTFAAWLFYLDNNYLECMAAVELKVDSCAGGIQLVMTSWEHIYVYQLRSTYMRTSWEAHICVTAEKRICAYQLIMLICVQRHKQNYCIYEYQYPR
jgi:hypothetical protein